MLITLTGASCSGKSTLERSLSTLGFTRIISFTTRQPRPGEENHVDYVFLDEAPKSDQVVEEIIYNNCHYGLLKSTMDQARGGKPCVVVVEPHGKKQVIEYCKKEGIQVVSFLIHQPPEVLAERYLKRFATLLANTSNVNYAYESKRMAMMFQEQREWISEVTEYDAVLGGSDLDAMVRTVYSSLDQILGVEWRNG